ncbi:DUF5958 family protein [Streptomyces sp. NY05-11A]
MAATPVTFRLWEVVDNRRRERFCSGGCGHWWHNPPVADG